MCILLLENKPPLDKTPKQTWFSMPSLNLYPVDRGRNYLLFVITFFLFSIFQFSELVLHGALQHRYAATPQHFLESTEYPQFLQQQHAEKYADPEGTRNSEVQSHLY